MYKVVLTETGIVEDLYTWPFRGAALAALAQPLAAAAAAAPLGRTLRRVPDSYWHAHEDQRMRVRTVAEALDPEETFDVLYDRATEFLRR